MKKVLVADGNRRLGSLMGELLDDDHRFTVVAVVDDAADAVEQARSLLPDVVLVSELLDGAGGAVVCGALRTACPTAAVLLWTHDPDLAGRRQPDADGLLQRGMTYEQLAQAVRHAARRPDAPPRVVDLSEAEAGRPLRGPAG